MPRLVATALWMMETARDAPASPEAIAQAAGVSVFHLTRAFAAVFGVTPGAVRRGAAIPPDRLQEAIAMTDPTPIAIDPPRIETTAAARIIGLDARYMWETNGAILGQWADFLARAEAEGLPLDGPAYGVCHDAAEDGGFGYLCGVAASAAPSGFATVTIPAGRYAVFTHRGPAATLRGFIGTVRSEHLPASGLPLSGGPDFERYPPGYDPTNPGGHVEIWAPLREAGAPS